MAIIESHNTARSLICARSRAAAPTYCEQYIICWICKLGEAEKADFDGFEFDDSFELFLGSIAVEKAVKGRVGDGVELIELA